MDLKEERRLNEESVSLGRIYAVYRGHMCIRMMKGNWSELKSGFSISYGPVEVGAMMKDEKEFGMVYERKYISTIIGYKAKK